jgi:cold-inducible RNA-binding protein
MPFARVREEEDLAAAAARRSPLQRRFNGGEGVRNVLDASGTLALQRSVGNHSVVDMIAQGRATTSVQRVGGRLYVGNLSFVTSRESLQDAFAAVGEVREVAMPTDRETGQPRGFAFVTMGSSQAASDAIATMNGAMLDGRPLRVNEAQERAPGGGGGGGGFGGGGRGGGGGGRGRDRY